jgi:hypothetical protein
MNKEIELILWQLAELRKTTKEIINILKKWDEQEEQENDNKG